MSQLIDLTQPFFDGMPGFTMTGPDGRKLACTAHIREVLSHADTAPLYDGQCAFAYTEARFVTSIGTRLDAPYIRYPEMRDIAGLGLEELVLPGLVVDLRGRDDEALVGAAEIDLPEALSGRAVLFNFGWDVHWGKARYLSPPALAPEVIALVIARGAKLVGVDTVSVDAKGDPRRPAHSGLLAAEVLIVEDLCRLDRLHGRDFRFFALPVPVRGAGSMPVRAFAEVPEAAS